MNPTADFKVADLCDEHADNIAVAEPLFRDFGGAARFRGAITTVRGVGDNSPVKAMLATEGSGGVLVVDGGGLLNFSLLGDKLGLQAVKNHWAGLVIYGCVRDTGMLATLDVGVKALAAYPVKTEKKDPGQINVAVRFAGVDFIPGHYLYADPDGIIVSAKKLD